MLNQYKDCKPKIILFKSVKYNKYICLSVIDFTKLGIEEINIYADKYLSNDEKTNLNEFKFLKRRKEFVLGRIASKYSLSTLNNINIPFKQITISRGVFNQPVVNSIYAPSTDISISHSHNFIYSLAFSGEFPCGIDAEYICKKKEETVYSILSYRERYILSEINISPLFLWTAKESLSKILKTGMTLNLSKMGVKSIKKRKNYYIGNYSDWIQYEFFSVIKNNEIVTITVPKNSLLLRL